MAWDGNGNFLRLYNWVTDKANSINITASRMDGEDTGFATAGFGNCVTRDGQGKMGAALLPSSTGAFDLGNSGALWKSLNGSLVTSTTGTTAYGPTSAGQVDLTPDSNTFTATGTGFVGPPTNTFTWYRVGKAVTLFFNSLSGTSNSVNFTITGLPAAIQPPTLAQTFNAPINSCENGNVTQGSPANVSLQIPAASGTITFLLSGLATGWTSSGVKGIIQTFSITYLLL